MTPLRDYLYYATARLKTAGVDSPRLSAELLLAHALGLTREDLVKTLILQPDMPLPGEALELARELTARREAGEPSAYLTGVKEFYGREFAVTPATLIPRPDTETLIETALAFAREYEAVALPLTFECEASTHSPACAQEGHGSTPAPFAFVDLGTGSGCIAVTLALELGERWHGTAVDISPAALDTARENAARLGAANLDFLEADFTKPLFDNASLDLVAANPPYVSEAEYAQLSPEVRDFEPKSALVPAVANADGLEHERILIIEAARILRPGGLLLLECGCTQGDALLQCVSDSNAGGESLPLETKPAWLDARILPDLAGLPRVLYAVRA